MKTTFGSFLMMITMMNSVFAQSENATIIRDESSDNLKCGGFGDTTHRLFKLKTTVATVDNCMNACIQDSSCVAFSAIWNSWCVGCNVPLYTSEAGAVAYKRNDGATESCRDVVEGEQCYTEVKWAMETGFQNNPEWYGSLTSTSSFAEFQDYFYQNSNLGKNGNSCPKPCLPVDCVGSWGEFGDCTSTCGGGTQTKTYTVQTQAANGGAACPDVQTETQACNTDACPVDCVGSWGEYGECTATCGGGTQTKTYTVQTQAENGGAACPDVQTQTQACNTDACPIDCVGSWGEYGNCTFTADGGECTQTKTYMVQTEAANGGVACPAVQTESQACSNTDKCKWTVEWTNENKVCNPAEKMADWNNLGEKSSFDQCAQSCYVAVGCTFASFNNDNTHCTGFDGSCSTTNQDRKFAFTVMKMIYPKVGQNVEMNPDEPQDVQRSLELEF